MYKYELLLLDQNQNCTSDPGFCLEPGQVLLILKAEIVMVGTCVLEAKMLISWNLLRFTLEKWPDFTALVQFYCGTQTQRTWSWYYPVCCTQFPPN